MTNVTKNRWQQKEDKNLRSSLAVEKKIVGYLGNNPEETINIVSKLKDRWFLNPKIREVFICLKKAYLDRTDPFVEMIQAKILPSLYAECLKSAAFTIAEVEQAIESLKTNYTKHAVESLVEKSSEKEAEKPHEFIAELQHNLLKLSSDNQFEDSSTVSALNDYDELLSTYKSKVAQGHLLLGESTGIPKLDEVIDGLRKGHLWVVGGYTSAGKTFFVLNIIAEMIRNKKKVAMFSLEMSNVDIIGRMMGLLTGISSYVIMKHELSQVEQTKVEEARELIRESGLTIHCKNNHIDSMLMAMLGQQMRGGLDLIVIDYAQLVQSNDKDEYTTLTNISVKLQAFAQKYEIPIILLSQISNESARNPESNMIGFKGSGALGASADIAIELISGEKDKDERIRKFKEGRPVDVRLIIKKNRHGRTGEIDMAFFPRTGEFRQGSSFEFDNQA